MATTTTPGLFNVNLRDFLRGALIAVLSAPVTIITQSLDAGSLKFDWKTIGIVCLSAFISYVVKNLLTPAEVIITNASKEEVKAVKDGVAEATIIAK